MSTTQSPKYTVLYLVDKHTYITKMSRVRFHGIEEISKITTFKLWGKGWDNYNDNLPVQSNINLLPPPFNKPDVVIGFKPLTYKGFADITTTKCIRYNEMYDFEWTTREIEESNADIIICHHENDMKTYQAYYSNYHGQHEPFKRRFFFHDPHCAKKSVFKDYNLPKRYDVMLAGRHLAKNVLGDYHYPLRDRLFKILPKLEKHGHRTYIHPHPKYTHDDSFTDRYLIEFAKAVNQARLCLTCSGIPKSRFGKYIEIPMCNVPIAADIPDQDQEDFREFVIELNTDMTDDEMVEKIDHYLRNQHLLDEVRDKGYQWAQQYGQDYYAQQFVKALDIYFKKDTADSTVIKVLPDTISTEPNAQSVSHPVSEKTSTTSTSILRGDKIYIVGANENWIIDTIKSEWEDFNPSRTTTDPTEATTIWLMADYKYKTVPLELLRSKYVVTTVHHIDPEKITQTRKKHFRTLASFTDKWHAICQRTADDMERHFNIPKDRTFVSPFWVNSKVWFPMADQKQELRTKYNLPQNRFLIGSFQRDTEGSSIKSGNYKPKLSKGPDTFFRIVKMLYECNPNLTVILAGWRRDYLIQRLEEAKIPHIYMERVETLEEMNELYNTLDLYIVASRTEGGPKAVFECAATKTPILSTNVGNTSNILNPLSIFKAYNGQDNEKDISDQELEISFFQAIPDISTAYKNVQKYDYFNLEKWY